MERFSGFQGFELPRTQGPARPRIGYGEVVDEDDDDDQRYRPSRENYRLSMVANQVPRMPWDEFVRQLQWKPGEHFAMVGPTGQGKTTMLLNLLPLHPYVVIFATKPRDDSMLDLLEQGYLKMERWKSIDPEKFPRRVLWPDATRINSEDKQKEIFHDAFARIYREGGWTVALDELWFVINILKLDQDVRVFLLQARALGISLVCATQRPSRVPLEVYDQSTHLMFWRDNDETNLKRLSGLASNQGPLIRMTIANLEQYQVLYVNTRTGQMVRTRAPAL